MNGKKITVVQKGKDFAEELDVVGVSMSGVIAETLNTDVLMTVPVVVACCWLGMFARTRHPCKLYSIKVRFR